MEHKSTHGAVPGESCSREWPSGLYRAGNCCCRHNVVLQTGSSSSSTSGELHNDGGVVTSSTTLSSHLCNAQSRDGLSSGLTTATAYDLRRIYDDHHDICHSDIRFRLRDENATLSAELETVERRKVEGRCKNDVFCHQETRMIGCNGSKTSRKTTTTTTTDNQLTT